ncbi:MAG: O-antigen ligase family protein, partial [Phenylobacterium sp.]
MFYAVVDSVRGDDLPRLLTVAWFGAGGVTVAFGLLQLHDRLTSLGGRWDWIAWDKSNFPIDSIWSTFGNPNHLAGFLAALLPVGLALALVATTRRVRLAIAALGVAALVELLFTGTVGGWLGAVAGLMAAGIVLLPELRARWRLVAGAAVAVVVIVVSAGFAIGPRRGLGAQFTAAFDLKGASTANQRLAYWRAALVMARERPLVGVGPDMYELRFSRHQDAEFVRYNGFALDVNGPHNTFLNRLSAIGVPGFALFVALIALASLRAVAAWRRLRRAELAGDRAARAPATAQRQLLAGVAGGLVAYLVQATFNVDQVGLSLLFWVFLGMLAVLTSAAGVLSSVRPRLLLSPSVPPPAAPRAEGKAPVG